jgi:tRNA modification GTPase
MKHSTHTLPTIAAIATAPGRSSVGIVRVSGSNVTRIAQALLQQLPIPRHAHYGPFYDQQQQVIDQGLALYFPKPHSFTGEDVLELHAHGSPIVLDLILQQLLQLGVTLARPGEFSERAFLNGKLDLAQAEAIADLIDASSEQAARSAVHSLQGEFSHRINQLLNALIDLRVYIEAMLDFSDEDIEWLSDGRIETSIDTIQQNLTAVQASAQQGAILRDGMHVVIAGRPNAGKSSLLNRLSGQETAIVTDIAGTTRDILREQIHIDGLPLHIIDTAGLRDSEDIVEREGIRRAREAIANADHILLLLDSSNTEPLDFTAYFDGPVTTDKLTLIYNKIDLTDQPAKITQHTDGHSCVYVSAKTGEGIDLLRQHLKSCLGFTATNESTFIARRRHLDALARAQQHLLQAKAAHTAQLGMELCAEELRLAQQALSEITGQFLPDDLLGEIFSRFCIGK